VPLMLDREVLMIEGIEVPKENWPKFLTMLNRLALERPVRVEVVQRELGDQEMGELLPLREIDFETKGSARGKLIIAVGSDRGELVHLIEVPTRFYVGINEAGVLEWLSIEEASLGKTIVHFEELPALPEPLPYEQHAEPS
jgi:hypothetical protein